MKQPYLQGDAFLADIYSHTSGPDRFRVWWLGQSGFMIAYDGPNLLFDPYLSDWLTRKYTGTDKPHTQITEHVIKPERLDFIDVVTSSHNHTDHLDAHTLGPIMRANSGVPVVVPQANIVFAAERLNVTPERLTPAVVGEPITVGAFTLTAVPAAHNELEQDANGHYTHVGYVAEFGPFTVYHSGDTLWWEGLVEALAPWDIDLALLPINGNLPERRVAGNLNGEEAVTLAQKIGAGMVIPCHYDMFAFNTVSPDEFKRAAEAAGQAYRVLSPGEGFTIQA